MEARKVLRIFRCLFRCAVAGLVLLLLLLLLLQGWPARCERSGRAGAWRRRIEAVGGVDEAERLSAAANKQLTSRSTGVLTK